MKKIFKYILLFLIIIIFTGCKYEADEFGINTEKPEATPIISGQWLINKHTVLENKIKDDSIPSATWDEKIIILNKEVAIFPNNTYKNPNYKLKIVDSNEYIFNKYGKLPKEIGIKEEEVKVVSISSKERYYEEIILIDDNNAIIENNDILYHLSRISEGDMDTIKKKRQNRGVSISGFEKSSIEHNDQKSGVLIGLKSKNENYNVHYPERFLNYTDNINNFLYRTIWIGYNGSTIEIKEIPYILLPRKSGFWKINSEKVVTEEKIYDDILISPLEKEQRRIALESVLKTNKSFYASTEINFICNDYVSVKAYSSILSEEGIGKSYEDISIIPVDTIYAGDVKDITASKILNKDGMKVLEKSIIGALNQGYDNKNVNIENFTSMSVERVPGKWSLNGRISTTNSNFDYVDFCIPIEIPQTILRYDSVYLPLTKVKDQVPKLKDVIFSPNKSLAVGFTNDKMLIYEVKGSNIKEEALAEIDLKSNEKIIMAEWATDEYVDNWSKEVSKVTKELNK